MECCALWPSRLSGKERRWVKYVGFERGDVYVRVSCQNGITVGHTEKLGSPKKSLPVSCSDLEGSRCLFPSAIAKSVCDLTSNVEKQGGRHPCHKNLAFCISGAENKYGEKWRD